MNQLTNQVFLQRLIRHPLKIPYLTLVLSMLLYDGQVYQGNREPKKAKPLRHVLPQREDDKTRFEAESRPTTPLRSSRTWRTLKLRYPHLRHTPQIG